MAVLSMVFWILSASCQGVATFMAVAQRRAADSVRDDLKQPILDDEPSDGRAEFDHEHLQSVLGRLAVNQRPYLRLIGFSGGGCLFAIVAAILGAL
jgi:hypothetical protein